MSSLHDRQGDAGENGCFQRAVLLNTNAADVDLVLQGGGMSHRLAAYFCVANCSKVMALKKAQLHIFELSPFLWVRVLEELRWGIWLLGAII